MSQLSDDDIPIEPAGDLSSDEESSDDEQPSCPTSTKPEALSNLDSNEAVRKRARTKDSGARGKKENGSASTAIAKNSTAKSKGESKAKKAKITEGDARTTVLAWFERENKPAVAVGIRAALGSTMSQALIQKALDALLEEGVLTSKEFKKTKVFYLPQKSFSSEKSAEKCSVSMSVEELRASITHLKAQEEELLAEAKALQVAIAKVESMPSLEELLKATQCLKSQNAVMLQQLQESKKKRNDTHQQQTVDVTPAMMQQVADEYFHYRSEWFRRRSLAKLAMECNCGDRKLEAALEEMGMDGGSPEDHHAANFVIPKRFIRDAKTQYGVSSSMNHLSLFPQQQSQQGKKITFLPRKRK